jgi:peptide/nickel transport system permease protein
MSDASAPAIEYQRAESSAPEVVTARRTYWQQVIRDTFVWFTARMGLAWVSVIAALGVFAPFIASSHPILMKDSAGVVSSPLLRHLTPVDVGVLVFACLILLTIFVPRLRRAGIAPLAAVLGTFALVTVVIFYGWNLLTFSLFDVRRDPEATWLLRGFVRGVWVVAHVGAIAVCLVLAWLCLQLWAFSASRLGRGVVPAVVAVALMVLAAIAVRPPQLIDYQRYRDMGRSGQGAWMVRTIIPYSPSDRLRDMPERRLTAPSRQHWLGTEFNGADVASRMIHACRIALAIGFIATGIAVTIGVIVGGLMGYYAGVFDLVGMRLIEILEAVPRLMLLLAITAMVGRNLYLMMLVIGLTGWMGDARFIRAEFLKLRKQDFVQAAIAAGLPMRSVLFRHMLPNGISPVLVTASFGIAAAILLETTLSFLGLGLIDEPSWGQLLNQARAGGRGFVWWLAVFPGLAIFLTVFAYTLIGEAVRDALDPKLRKRE